MGNVSLRNEIKMLMGKKTKIALGVAVFAAVVGISSLNLPSHAQEAEPVVPTAQVQPKPFEEEIKKAKEFLAEHKLPESRLVVDQQRKTLQLNLSETKVTNLSPLKGLTNLQELNLYGTKVTDLSPLKELMKLQQLKLRETQVPDSAIEELQKAIPKLRIIRLL